MDVAIEDDDFLIKLFHCEKGETLENAVKRFLGWENEADALGRLRQSMGAQNCEGSQLLWLACLFWLRQHGFTAVSFPQLLAQLVQQLSVFVDVFSVQNDENIWPVLKRICVALVGIEPEDKEKALVMLRVAGVPVVVRSLKLPNFQSPPAFVQLALCLVALRNPSVLVLNAVSGNNDQAHQWMAHSRVDAHKRELKEAGENVQLLQALVMSKQRQLEVEAAKFNKLHRVTKDEKTWLSSKILELEEALRGGRETEELERELEEARREVLLLNAKQEKDSETIIAMRRQIEAVESEAEEIRVALTQKVNEAKAEPRTERPARQIGGMKWVYLPWFMLLFCSVSVTGLYIWAYYNGHLFLDEHIPFISSAIDYPPESCVGSMFLSIVAFLILMIVAIRWRLNTDALDAFNLSQLSSSRYHHRLNGFAFVAGIIASLAVIGIGSFQEHNIPQGHLAFGACFFGFMLISMLGNTVIDFRVQTSVVGLRVFRLIVLILAACIFAAVVVMYQFTDIHAVFDAKSVLEIVDSFLVFLYLMTYSYDFSGVQMLFDVRKLTQTQYHNKAKESEDMPLLAHLDGDIF